MTAARYLRDAAVFVPCYIALDWASYIDPVGPFNITPWNPQPALAIVWMMLAGLGHAPAVLATIALADIAIRHAPGGYAVTLASALILTGGYAVMAWSLRAQLASTDLRSSRQLTVFVSVVVLGTSIVGACFVGLLYASSLVADASMVDAWLRFWIGDAVGVLVTAPLLLAVADRVRRARLLSLARRPEVLLQIGVLVGTLWLIFNGLGGDPSDHFYFLFLPLIWIAARTGMSGAIVATAIVQIGVVIGVQDPHLASYPIVELQALVAALTLTGLYLGMMVDERERAAEGMKQTMRLAAAGEMAGAIAHEVNQPLTALANYARSAELLLAADHRAVPELREIVGKMLPEAQRAADVVRRLRDFFRTGTTRLEAVEVRELLAIARRIALQLAGSHAITVETEGNGTLPSLFIDRLQIELVFRNLLSNAIESIVSTRLQDGRVNIIAQLHDESHVCFVVSDSGPGILPATRPGLFEPFVSGKPTGMGLGLAVSRAIAEAHGGTLEAPAVEHGEFHLVLPCPKQI